MSLDENRRPRAVELGVSASHFSCLLLVLPFVGLHVLPFVGRHSGCCGSSLFTAKEVTDCGFLYMFVELDL